MLRSIIFLTLVGSSVPQVNDIAQYLVARILNPIYLFDGPSWFATAARNTSNKRLSYEDLVYYNYFAGGVYCTDQLANLTCTSCKKFKDDASFATVLTNDTTSSAVLIVTQPVRKQIVVSYRGSSSLTDYILDFTLLNVHIGNNIRVHRGFLLTTNSLYPRVVAILQQELAKNPGFKVVLTGHSLGGAMASHTLFFFKYNDQFPNVDFVLVTYGQPRVGNIEYANFMNSLDVPMVRVVNKADIVPHVAGIIRVKGTDFFDNYIHHQTEYWLKDDNGRYCSDEVHEDPTCSNSLGPVYSIVDHLAYMDDINWACVIAHSYASISVPWVINTDYLSGLLPIIPQVISPVLGSLVTGVYPALNLIL